MKCESNFTIFPACQERSAVIPIEDCLRSVLLLILATALINVFIPSARAQTATLIGKVTDSSGSAVPGADLSLRNRNTDVAIKTQSNSDGEYSFRGLNPGTYEVRVEQRGFETLQRSGITLNVDTTTRLDMSLAVGRATETVEVNSDVNQLQPNSADISTDISSKQYDDLPLIQLNRVRDPSSFVYLAPGVQGNIALNGDAYTGATNIVAVNGSPIWTTEIILDGLPEGGTRYNGDVTESSPTVDAVGEFKITTTLLPADYGHSGYAVGSFSVKSGTNQLHGSAYEYFRNSVLNAANWYAKNQGSPLANPPDHQNEFGGTLGGPIQIPHIYNGRSRSFFFYAFGGSRYTGATIYTTSTVPTAQEMTVNSAGYYDFSDLTTPIYNPATTTTNPAGSGYVRTKFAGNLIPASQVDPVAKAILSYFPIPAAGKTTIGGFAGDRLLSPDSSTAKIDHDFTPNQRLSTTLVRTSVPRIYTSSGYPIPLASGYHQDIGTTTFRLNDEWTISQSVVNSAAVGFNRYTNPQSPTGTSPDYPGELGLKGLAGGLFPTFTLTGYTTFGDILADNKVENDYLYRDNLFWSFGHHNLRFGGEFRAIQYNDFAPDDTTGAFSFKTNETGNPQSQSGTGNAFASFLLGQVDSATITSPFPLLTRKSISGIFAQDDWKALPSLTVNLGFRFEWEAAPTEAHNNQSIISLSTPNPGAGNLPGALVFAGPQPTGIGSPRLFSTDYSGLGPRIGFAYQLRANTVVRGGYGIYYSEMLPDLAISDSGFSPVGIFTNTTGSVSPVFTLGSGVPNYSANQTITPTALNGATGSYYGPNVGAMPRTQNYSLTLQYQLTTNSSVEVAYIGVHNSRQVASNMVNINQVNPSYLSLGSALLTSTANTTNLAKAGISAPYPGFTGTIAQALRPYPQYSTLTSLGAKAGNSVYNAGQVLYKIRPTHGLMLNANYTFSKLLGFPSVTLEGNSGTDNTVQNAYDPDAERSILPDDVRHALVINSAYDFPFGRNRLWLNKGGLAESLAGGWTISGIQRYQSGYPLSILMSSNSLPIFNYYQRPNIAAGVDPSSHTPNSKFNPANGSNIFNLAAFSAPGNSSFGNAKPTYSNLREYTVLGEDIGLFKRTPLGEHLVWTFYSQAFNAFNRHRFIGFGTSFGSSSFGQPSGTTAARAIQFGSRLQF